MKTLGKLFGSENRVKILRLFLVSPDVFYTKDEVVKKTRVRRDAALKEINLLKKIKFIEEKKLKINGGPKKGIVVLAINQNFEYLDGLKELLLGSEILNGDELLNKLKGVGKVKLVVTSGIFMESERSPADILIVGDGIKKKKLSGIVKALESEIGREIRYTVFDTEDFKYRLTVYDKFVREIMDFPHNKVLDKLFE